MVHTISDAVLKTYGGIIFLDGVWKKVQRIPPKNQKKCLRAPAREFALRFSFDGLVLECRRLPVCLVECVSIIVLGYV